MHMPSSNRLSPKSACLAALIPLLVAACNRSEPAADPAPAAASPAAAEASPAPAAAPAATASPTLPLPPPRTTADGAQLVDADNIVRAETDVAFAGMVTQGTLGTFTHNRGMTPLDQQTVLRQNRDTLYSGAVFDLDAGPVTITLPDAGTRFMSMQVFDQDQYTHQVGYRPGAYTLRREDIGTRYAAAAVRILANPSDPADLQAVHALQDQIQVSQPGGPGTFEVPRWDMASLGKLRDAFAVLGDSLPDKNRMFGSKAEVDPVRRVIGAVTAWGGNPEKDATYLNFTPARNDGRTVHTLTVKDVPVDGFWSVTVYDAKGYFQRNELDAYSVNNLTATKADDGSVTVQFGGCDGKVPNCLPVTPGWNYLVRLYRPRAEILDGTWKFPEPQARG
ncbi:DUF1254 domain-containing protein [Pseudoxanthomonas sp. 10H]|uniref:DUF1254 domain-containing protein n=1 Tax=Pseudoxanthomonas sp. 10H TaxID=3242729 RepID=UPI00355893BE